MRNVRRTCAALTLVLVACAGTADPGPGPNEPPGAATPSPLVCALPAPVKSEDTCAKDADCAPSVPCHARACVAASRAVSRTPDTVCTMSIDCQSADVNPCLCYEGRCALVPKAN